MVLVYFMYVTYLYIVYISWVIMVEKFYLRMEAVVFENIYILYY